MERFDCKPLSGYAVFLCTEVRKSNRVALLLPVNAVSSIRHLETVLKYEVQKDASIKRDLHSPIIVHLR